MFAGRFTQWKIFKSIHVNPFCVILLLSVPTFVLDLGIIVIRCSHYHICYTLIFISRQVRWLSLWKGSCEDLCKNKSKHIDLRSIAQFLCPMVLVRVSFRSFFLEFALIFCKILSYLLFSVLIIFCKCSCLEFIVTCFVSIIRA